MKRKGRETSLVEGQLWSCCLSEGSNWSTCICSSIGNGGGGSLASWKYLLFQECCTLSFSTVNAFFHYVKTQEPIMASPCFLKQPLARLKMAIIPSPIPDRERVHLVKIYSWSKPLVKKKLPKQLSSFIFVGKLISTSLLVHHFPSELIALFCQKYNVESIKYWPHLPATRRHIYMVVTNV